MEITKKIKGKNLSPSDVILYSNCINLRHGFGTLRRLNSFGQYERVYVGEWLANRKHGKGRQFYQNGDSYYGHWANGQKNGNGIMWYNDPIKMYVGEWKDDKYDGAGVLFQG